MRIASSEEASKCQGWAIERVMEETQSQESTGPGGELDLAQVKSEHLRRELQDLVAGLTSSKIEDFQAAATTLMELKINEHKLRDDMLALKAKTKTENEHSNTEELVQGSKNIRTRKEFREAELLSQSRSVAQERDNAVSRASDSEFSDDEEDLTIDGVEEDVDDSAFDEVLGDGEESDTSFIKEDEASDTGVLRESLPPNHEGHEEAEFLQRLALQAKLQHKSTLLRGALADNERLMNKVGEQAKIIERYRTDLRPGEEQAKALDNFDFNADLKESFQAVSSALDLEINEVFGGIDDFTPPPLVHLSFASSTHDKSELTDVPLGMLPKFEETSTDEHDMSRLSDFDPEKKPLSAMQQSRSALQESKKENQQLKEEKEGLLRDLESLADMREQEKEFALQEIEGLKQNAENQNMRIADLNMQVKRFQEERKDLINTIKQREDEIGSLKREKHYMELEYNAQSAQIEFERLEHSNAKKEIANMERQVEELRGVCSKFTKNSMEQKQEYHRSMDHLKAEKDRLEEEMRSWKTRANNQQNTILLMEKRMQGSASTSRGWPHSPKSRIPFGLFGPFAGKRFEVKKGESRSEAANKRQEEMVDDDETIDLDTLRKLAFMRIARMEQQKDVVKALGSGESEDEEYNDYTSDEEDGSRMEQQKDMAKASGSNESEDDGDNDGTSDEGDRSRMESQEDMAKALGSNESEEDGGNDNTSDDGNVSQMDPQEDMAKASGSNESEDDEDNDNTSYEGDRSLDVERKLLEALQNFGQSQSNHLREFVAKKKSSVWDKLAKESVFSKKRRKKLRSFVENSH